MKIKNFFRRLSGKAGSIEGKSTLYRMMALFGTIAVLIQCIVWGSLCVTSLTYYGIGAPHSGKNENLMSAYGYIFSTVYYNKAPLTKRPKPHKKKKPTKRPPLGACANVTDNGLFAITSIYLFLTIHLLIASVLLFLAASDWNNGKTIRLRVTHWIIAVFLMSAWEFSTGLIFFIDFLVCSEQGQHHVAAAALTLCVLFFKGFVLFVLNIGLSLSLFCIQYCGSKCPV